jgi:4-amino-4-deoxy-L-arabinose transferase-like glycosyltransferase
MQGERAVVVEPVGPTSIARRARAGILSRLATDTWLLLAILLVASIARLYWAAHDRHIVTGDECEYLRLAENLVKAHRYVGLFEGPQLMYPPLFSLLIAGLSSVIGSVAAAGEMVSFIASLFVIVVVFVFARDMYGTRVGLLSAVFTAFHPALIELSDAVYSESLYLPLVVAGVLFGVRYVEGTRWKHGVACGLCFGCAYLTRPEALVYPFVIVAALVATSGKSRASFARVIARGLLVVAVAGLVAAPYVIYLSRHTGRLQLEGKSAMNHAIGQRIRGGMDYTEATLGLGADLHEDGPFLSPNRWVLQGPSSVPIVQWFRHWPFTAHRNKEDLEDCVLYLVFGPIGVGFVTLGLFGQPWGRRRLAREAIILAVVIGYTVILLGQHHIAFRYVVPLLPFFLVWGANGANHATHWYGLTSRGLTRGSSSATKRLASGVGYAVIFGLLLLGLHRLSWVGDFHSHSPGEEELRQAGEWIGRHHAGSSRVMSATNEVPFYANAVALRFPFADSTRALAYVHATHPDFVVLSRDRSLVGAYYRDWFEHGVPDPAARLVDRVGPANAPHTVIYAWGAAP